MREEEADIRQELAERREAKDRLIEELRRLDAVLKEGRHPVVAPPPPADDDQARRGHWWRK